MTSCGRCGLSQEFWVLSEPPDRCPGLCKVQPQSEGICARIPPPAALLTPARRLTFLQVRPHYWWHRSARMMEQRGHRLYERGLPASSVE